MAYSFPGIPPLYEAHYRGLSYAFSFLLRRMIIPTTTTARASATTRTIMFDSIVNLLSGEPDCRGARELQRNLDAPCHFRLALRVRIAGASNTMNRHGKIKKTRGNRILIFVLAAASSARRRRAVRISSE